MMGIRAFFLALAYYVYYSNIPLDHISINYVTLHYAILYNISYNTSISIIQFLLTCISLVVSTYPYKILSRATDAHHVSISFATMNYPPHINT